MRILLVLALSLSLFGQGTKRAFLGIVDQPSPPTDSPGGGTYGSTQSVTLSDPTSTLILYTTDGSTPACPATGTLYTGAISVSVTTTIKAIGCNGITGGGVLTSTYTISGGGSLSLVQSKWGGNYQASGCSFSGTDVSCAFGSNTTSGSIIAGCVGWNGSSTGLTVSITSDSQGLTWTIPAASKQVFDTTTHYSEIGTQCFYSSTTGAAAETVVVRVSSSTFTQDIFLYEIGGGAVYQASSTGTGTSTTQASGSLTPSANNSFIIGMAVADGPGTLNLFTAGSGFTILGQYGGGSFSIGSESQAQGTAAAVTGNFSTGASSVQWATSQIVFHP